MKPEEFRALSGSLLLFYPGIHRSTGRNHNDIHTRMASTVKDNAEAYGKMRDLAIEMKESLSNGKWQETGKLLHKNWLLKKELAEGISDPQIDSHYNTAVRAGAEGGKLIGAGGGGFMLFYVLKEKHDGLRKALNMREEPFEFDPLGSRIAHIEE